MARIKQRSSPKCVRHGTAINLIADLDVYVADAVEINHTLALDVLKRRFSSSRLLPLNAVIVPRGASDLLPYRVPPALNELRLHLGRDGVIADLKHVAELDRILSLIAQGRYVEVWSIDNLMRQAAQIGIVAAPRAHVLIGE